jgi:hypothetical protein
MGCWVLLERVNPKRGKAYDLRLPSTKQPIEKGYGEEIGRKGMGLIRNQRKS